MASDLSGQVTLMFVAIALVAPFTGLARHTAIPPVVPIKATGGPLPRSGLQPVMRILLRPSPCRRNVVPMG
jgi:hypothetical protein